MTPVRYVLERKPVLIAGVVVVILALWLPTPYNRVLEEGTDSFETHHALYGPRKKSQIVQPWGTATGAGAVLVDLRRSDQLTPIEIKVYSAENELITSGTIHPADIQDDSLAWASFDKPVESAGQQVRLEFSAPAATNETAVGLRFAQEDGYLAVGIIERVPAWKQIALWVENNPEPARNVGWGLVGLIGTIVLGGVSIYGQQYRRQLLVLALLGVAVTTILIRLQNVFEVQSLFGGDAYNFVLKGRAWLEGRDPFANDFRKAPLLPFLLLPGVFSGDPLLWGRIINILSAAAAAVGTSLIARRLNISWPFALAAGFLTAVNREMWWQSLQGLSNVPYTALVVLSSYAFLWSARHTGRYLTGVLSGLSVLMRFEGALVGAVLIPAVWLRSLVKNKMSGWRGGIPAPRSTKPDRATAAAGAGGLPERQAVACRSYGYGLRRQDPPAWPKPLRRGEGPPLLYFSLSVLRATLVPFGILVLTPFLLWPLTGELGVRPPSDITEDAGLVIAWSFEDYLNNIERFKVYFGRTWLLRELVGNQWHMLALGAGAGVALELLRRTFKQKTNVLLALAAIAMAIFVLTVVINYSAQLQKSLLLFLTFLTGIGCVTLLMRRPAQMVPLGVLLLIQVAFVTAILPKDRYYLQIVPFLALAVVAGIDTLRSRARWSAVVALSTLGLLIGVVYAQSAQELPGAVSDYNSKSKDNTVMMWAAQHLRGSEGVVAVSHRDLSMLSMLGEGRLATPSEEEEELWKEKPQEIVRWLDETQPAYIVETDARAFFDTVIAMYPERFGHLTSFTVEYGPTTPHIYIFLSDDRDS